MSGAWTWRGLLCVALVVASGCGDDGEGGGPDARPVDGIDTEDTRDVSGHGDGAVEVPEDGRDPDVDANGDGDASPADGETSAECAEGCGLNARCVMGRCACDEGYGRCGDDGAAGCLTPLNESAAHCGGCDSPCEGGAVCAGGACVETCDAPRRWCGEVCADTDTSREHCGECDEGCGVHSVCEGGECGCAEGFDRCDPEDPIEGCTQSLDDAAHCGRCGLACLNGGWCEEGQCRCAPGYAGETCADPVCEGGCGQGGCVAPGECACELGWSGSACDAPVCLQGCANGGCLQPGGCDCDAGWQGALCDEAICVEACVNGACAAPDACACDAGWDGPTCAEAVCAAGCAEGTCVAPDDCRCEDGWQGVACDTVVDFSVTYVLNGGEDDHGNPERFDVTTPETALLAPTRVGFEFEGWFADPELTEAVGSIGGGAKGDLTLHAGWAPINFPITYVLNGGEEDHGNPASYTAQSPDITLEAASREGYAFTGWFRDAALTERVEVIEAGSMGELTLFAGWIESFSITYEIGGGVNPLNPTFYTVESETIILAPARQGGHRFERWFLDPEHTEEITEIPQGSTGDLTLYATWFFYEFRVGDTGPAGGIIARINTSSIWRRTHRYLEVSRLGDQFDAQWGSVIVNVEGTSVAPGSGRANTERIDAAFPGQDFAANRVMALEIGGYSDWGVPSRGDLDAMFAVRDTIFVTPNVFYWSSSDDTTPSRAWAKGMTTGTTQSQPKNANLAVRPVRAF